MKKLPRLTQAIQPLGHGGTFIIPAGTKCRVATNLPHKNGKPLFFVAEVPVSLKNNPVAKYAIKSVGVAVDADCVA